MDRSRTSTPSLWEATGPGPILPGTPGMPGDRCDACVIGAGIAGLTAAYLLALEGRKVVVLEARTVGAGMTSKTTAHLACALDDRFTEVERVRGEAVMRAAAQSHAAAIDRIERAVRDEAIDCGFARLDGYLMLAPGMDRGILEQEHNAARRAGLEEVELLEGSPLPVWSAGPCLRFPRQGQFHPLEYLAGLARAVRRLGGEIVEHARALEVASEGPDRARVALGPGRELRAGSVVVATNSPFLDRFAIHTKQAPYLTYAIAAPIPKGSVEQALYWDTADPYHYVRLARGEGGGPMLIIGGEDHKTGQECDPGEHYARLERWAREVFPRLGPVTHRWLGQVMETIDGLGFIGRNPGDGPNIYVATGDSGMGMTHGTIAGMLIAGRPSPWEEAYDPSRAPVRAARDYLAENLNVAAQYADWLTAGLSAEAGGPPPGGGMLARDGARVLAVHRAEDGRLHACSAVCPHLGCIVSWNGADRTWDCPCHGSRFDALGRVLQGPANRDLAPAGAG